MAPDPDDDRDATRNTPRRWGVMEHGKFRSIPKQPMLLGGMGPPPFEVTLPDGVTTLLIIEEPEA